MSIVAIAYKKNKQLFYNSTIKQIPKKNHPTLVSSFFQHLKPEKKQKELKKYAANWLSQTDYYSLEERINPANHQRQNMSPPSSPVL